MIMQASLLALPAMRHRVVTDDPSQFAEFLLIIDAGLLQELQVGLPDLLSPTARCICSRVSDEPQARDLSV
jgi:hypothetical protein